MSFNPSLDYAGVTRKFSSRMTEGQKMTGHNQSRKEFYSKVVQKAKQLQLERVSNLQISPYLTDLFLRRLIPPTKLHLQRERWPMILRTSHRREVARISLRIRR
jgi:hypothetical protein